ncbi:DUF2335 domain-containing protein [Ornithobacterium rhinotracheale]|uniref:DUF2335 domain-containing protein n=1 Tax=Ornithobacterium rhinotracheale TaxID=28251 RepID=UPI001FF1373A|nr:DUF2335 domain-containing protein [Ornithobacterium rhinotracheale]MCK0205479.1 DUF2335 domain-containing protein [Ornithobacterium rhinotracheale]
MEEACKSEIEKLEKDLSNDPNLLKNIDETQKKQLIEETVAKVVQIVSVERTHSRPLPDVTTLEGYNRIIPNGGERLMRQVELQSEHRRKLEASVVKSNNRQSFLGQIIGALIAFSFLIASYLLASNGHEIAASTLGGGTLVGLVTVFVYGKKTEKEDF